MYVQQDQQQLGPSLYQVPTCTICIDRMSRELAVLKCGHVFHEKCIRSCIALSKGNQYNRECPICKDRIHSERDAKKLYFDLQQSKNKDDVVHIQKIVQQIASNDMQLDALSKAIGKLTRITSENEVLYQKIEKKQKQINILLESSSQHLKQIAQLQNKLKQKIRQNKDLQVQNNSLRQYTCLLDDEKQVLERKLKIQLKDLQQLKMIKKAQMDIEKDNNYYEAIKRQYLINNPSEGIDYFCQLAEGLKLDIKRLQKNAQNSQLVIKQTQFAACEYKKQIQSYKLQIEKEDRCSKIWKDKYLKLQQMNSLLLSKLKDENIDFNSIINQKVSKNQKVKKSIQCTVPKMLTKKDVKADQKKTEKDVFLQFGSGIKRLEKKKPSNLLLF